MGAAVELAPSGAEGPISWGAPLQNNVKVPDGGRMWNPTLQKTKGRAPVAHFGSKKSESKAADRSVRSTQPTLILSWVYFGVSSATVS